MGAEIAVDNSTAVPIQDGPEMFFDTAVYFGTATCCPMLSPRDNFLSKIADYAVFFPISVPHRIRAFAAI